MKIGGVFPPCLANASPNLFFLLFLYSQDLHISCVHYPILQIILKLFCFAHFFPHCFSLFSLSLFVVHSHAHPAA
jgi:hypothetical protein